MCFLNSHKGTQIEDVKGRKRGLSNEQICLPTTFKEVVMKYWWLPIQLHHQRMISWRYLHISVNTVWHDKMVKQLTTNCLKTDIAERWYWRIIRNILKLITSITLTNSTEQSKSGIPSIVELQASTLTDMQHCLYWSESMQGAYLRRCWSGSKVDSDSSATIS